MLDPFIEDPQQLPGGKHSRINGFHPYANEHEMTLAFKYIFTTEDIAETTSSLWIGTQLDFQAMLAGDEQQTPPKKPRLQEDGLKILDSRSRPVRSKTPEATIHLTDLPPPPSKSKATGGLPTPPDRYESVAVAAPPSQPPFVDYKRRSVSYTTLQDVYGLLDRIERTSYVGALFLEAYAERLRDDYCKACWLKRNVNLDWH
ncbi:uncharacterized protein M421DRAFT_380901 [Didymella exigua CBS 183.55]|uniref:Uncharacterized protein n=1 Tax=Didymella exigua CBS 183.55 TaxID=1150837 RepID=A0A6A5RQJ8_9PLEO|nr:uncharacterized protein M421DRAFT_380901 [Didymella exigua CBS 183.55]KAF1929939.1 hypothetical protein M421DRAFT_380901 [Didymella exigua CBS 183.55]